MDNINISELDSMVYVYFGPNYADFEPGHEIAPKIEAWLSWAGKGNKYALIDDIDLFLSECDDVDADFAKRYKGAFVPELWNTTASEFLKQVKDRVSNSLHSDKNQGEQ